MDEQLSVDWRPMLWGKCEDSGVLTNYPWYIWSNNSLVKMGGSYESSRVCISSEGLVNPMETKRVFWTKSDHGARGGGPWGKTFTILFSVLSCCLSGHQKKKSLFKMSKVQLFMAIYVRMAKAGNPLFCVTSHL